MEVSILKFCIFWFIWYIILSECGSNTYGQNCASRCSCDFSNTQLCDKKNGTCYCKEGWQGASCSEDVLECANTTICGSNAHCSETNGSYICNCDVGYKKDAFGSCVGKFISFSIQIGKQITFIIFYLIECSQILANYWIFFPKLISLDFNVISICKYRITLTHLYG